ncbi:MAG: tRNA pseudouridine32 synthase/23S rRNA pseudouridine746 synthase [Polaribacter sp.]|jgi:tRNA pseudouridine32 synthase/23S rRNA pseudouridine746 synthase
MDCLQYFTPQPSTPNTPSRLRNPFENNPHPLAITASDMLKEKLRQTYPEFDIGKMFGVLVVSDQAGSIGFLSSFSGMLNQQWNAVGFVPPVFDIDQQQLFLDDGATTVNGLTATIEQKTHCPDYLMAIAKFDTLEQQQSMALDRLKAIHKSNKEQRRLERLQIPEELERDATDTMKALALLSQQDKRTYLQLKQQSQTLLYQANAKIDQDYRDKITQLKNQRRDLSQRLHDQVFDTYQLKNSQDEVSAVRSLFDGKKPPSGTGDCAAPKLLQFAFNHQLKPLALAEFWWGRPPATGVRHHGNLYSPCRGKCHPILPFMLKGLDVESSDDALIRESLVPTIVYEDADIVVVNKPADLLSIPGKEEHHSVLSWLRKQYPDATGALLVHRLDMSTSGLLLAAKTAQAHKYLQKQFINRTIQKRYIAVLSKVIAHEDKLIDLPLRVDLDDRPRQVVCYEHGKAAVTRMEVISSDAVSTRVHFYPITGRTHQLRVHAAHCNGLAAPIIGDDLYGTRGGRLLLHAQMLDFNHPTTGYQMKIETPAPF